MQAHVGGFSCRSVVGPVFSWSAFWLAKQRIVCVMVGWGADHAKNMPSLWMSLMRRRVRAARQNEDLQRVFDTYDPQGRGFIDYAGFLQVRTIFCSFFGASRLTN